MRAVVIAVLALAAIWPQRAVAWGQEGHSIVAEIAERRLDPAILAKVRSLLSVESGVKDGQVSLASIASWADDYRAKHTESSNWHFVDIPVERSTYVPDTDCKADPKGDCVINAITRFRAALADCAKPPADRAFALKFLVHLVGDVHQPLHTSERNGDHGGNDVMVTFFGQSTKLHALWDSGIILHAVYAWGSYVERLTTGWFAGRDLTGLDDGTPTDWALESHQFAREVVYDIPDGGVLELNYYNKALPIVDRQLAVAGLRLSRLLKETLQPTAACP